MLQKCPNPIFFFLIIGQPTFQHKNKNMNFNVMLDNKNTAANYTIAAVLTMYKIFL